MHTTPPPAPELDIIKLPDPVPEFFICHSLSGVLMITFESPPADVDSTKTLRLFEDWISTHPRGGSVLAVPIAINPAVRPDTVYFSPVFNFGGNTSPSLKFNDVASAIYLTPNISFFFELFI